MQAAPRSLRRAPLAPQSPHRWPSKTPPPLVMGHATAPAQVIGREFVPDYTTEVSRADISEATQERSIADLSARSERSPRSSRSALGATGTPPPCPLSRGMVLSRDRPTPDAMRAWDTPMPDRAAGLSAAVFAYFPSAWSM